MTAATWRLLEQDPTTMPPTSPSTPTPPPAETPPAVASAPARGLWLPLPGAPALYDHRPRPLALSAVGVTLLTGAAVYAVGGVGMEVPWTEAQGAWADPLFLSGVGLSTWVVSSLLVNHLVGRASGRPQPKPVVALQLR